MPVIIELCLANVIQTVIAAFFIALTIVPEESSFLFEKFQHMLFVHEFLEWYDFQMVFTFVIFTASFKPYVVLFPKARRTDFVVRLRVECRDFC